MRLKISGIVSADEDEMKKRLQMQRRGLVPVARQEKAKWRWQGTYWNFEKCRARKCEVELEGGRRVTAVEVDEANQYGPQPFYLDDSDGSGWFKVTTGRGSPWCEHTSLDHVIRVVEYAEASTNE